MNLLTKIVIGFVILVGVVIAGLYATGQGPRISLYWSILFDGPAEPFDPDNTPPAPDYADATNWAALPSRSGLEDRLPEGVSATHEQGSAPADVFFIHPTGYLIGNSWVSPMDPNSKTEENTRWMMANQASAYNGCCNVYAPRYREANIFVYVQRDKSITERVLDFAYQDVERAFDYFIDHLSQGRPFIIASHSQGTHHATRLLTERIDGSPLHERMVAAYVIGGRIPASAFQEMQHIELCQSAEQTGCAMHWDTYSEAAIDDEMPEFMGTACVNPLSWREDGERAGKDKHLGGVPPVGTFHLDLTGDDIAQRAEIEPPAAPIANVVEAQCKNGILFVTDVSGTGLAMPGRGIEPHRYHGLDYPLFHMDIRRNAELRVERYLQGNDAGVESEPEWGNGQGGQSGETQE
jgi:hypothetical protein